MDIVVGIHASAALVLVVAGAAKVARPGPTLDLLATLGVALPAPAVVGLGVIEVGAALTALGGGGRVPAAAVGALYVGFVAVIARALMVGAESCGCFGRVDAPPSMVHLIGNASFAAASLAVAVGGRSTLDVMGDQPAGGIVFVALVGVLAGLAIVAFTALPESRAARRPGSGVGGTFEIHDDARGARS